jgi:hypothetical protein
VSATTSTPPAGTSRSAPSSVTPPGFRRTGTAGGSPWPGYGRSTATTPARSRCSRRPSASTRVSTHRRCQFRRSGPGCGCSRVGWTTRSTSCGSGGCLLTTAWTTSADTSTSHSPGRCSRGTSPKGPNARSPTRRGSSHASCGRRRRVGGWEASSRSWCSRRWRSGRKGTPERDWHPSAARSSLPSRRATSGSFWTRARPSPRCCEPPRSPGRPRTTRHPVKDLCSR